MKHVLKRLYIFMDQSMFKIVIGINMKWTIIIVVLRIYFVLVWKEGSKIRNIYI